MRNTDDQTIIDMKQQGITNKAIAEHFRVSPQYIGKRIKYIESCRLPESFEKLTTKQQKFALAIAEGKTKTDAAMTAFDCTTRDSAKALGYKESNDPDVAVAINDLLHQEGIGRRRRIQRLKDMIECSDLSIVGKGLDMANKLTGDYKADQTAENVFTLELIERARKWREEQEEKELKKDAIDIQEVYQPE